MNRKKYMSDFEKAYSRYEKTFGKNYPYVQMNQTLKESTADIGQRVRSKIPVPDEEQGLTVEKTTAPGERAQRRWNRRVE